MTAKDLKNSLLQEAVQGKLVPQIASEGNARDLLEEIRKERLSHGFANSYGICDGKNKKTKSSDLRSKSQISVTKKELPEITEDEIPFEIPESWCWCRLGEICSVITDGDHLPPPQVPHGIPFLVISNVVSGFMDFSNTRYVPNEYFDKIPDYKKANPNDILFTVTGSYGVAVLVNTDRHFCFQRHIALLKPLVNSEFLVWLLNSLFVKKMCDKEATGTAQKTVSLSVLRNLPIPLPPLAEQKRIVSAIEKFMPLIEEYGKKETELKAFNEQIGTFTKKAILQEAVQGRLVPQIASEGNARDLLEEIKKEKAKLIREGKIKKDTTKAGAPGRALPEITEDEIPFDIPESWCWCRLSELCNLYTGDSINETEKKLKYTNVKEGWFYIGTKDVNFDQTINYDNGIKIPFEKDNFRIAPKNTVLMCIEGGSAGRKIAFTNQDVCFGNKLCCFNSYKNEIEKFIFYFLQSTLFTDAFKDNINGIIGGVSINNLKGMLFPLPPLAEQKRIVDFIEKMLPLCEKVRE